MMRYPKRLVYFKFNFITIPNKKPQQNSMQIKKGFKADML